MSEKTKRIHLNINTITKTIMISLIMERRNKATTKKTKATERKEIEKIIPRNGPILKYVLLDGYLRGTALVTQIVAVVVDVDVDVVIAAATEVLEALALVMNWTRLNAAVGTIMDAVEVAAVVVEDLDVDFMVGSCIIMDLVDVYHVNLTTGVFNTFG